MPVALQHFTPLNSGSPRTKSLFFKIAFFCFRRRDRFSIFRFSVPVAASLRKKSRFSKTIIFRVQLSRSSVFFKIQIFCIIAVRRFHVFKYCNLSPRRDPFCFPKSAFIAPVLPSLNSFQIPFFSACSAVFLLVFEIISFLPSAMIVFKYHDFLFSRLSFLKSILFCIAPRSFSKTMICCALFWKMQFSCFGFGKLPIITPRSSGRFSFGKIRKIAIARSWKNRFLHFWKIKADHSPSIRKFSRYWKIIFLVCYSGRFASADHNKHTNIVCLYWKISNKMMFLLYIGKFHSDHDYMENFIRKI